jgi:integrase
MPRASLVATTDAEDRRADVLVGLGDLSAIKCMAVDKLIALQGLLGFGSVWGVIEIPQSYMPAGAFQKPSKRIFDFRKLSGGDDATISAIVRVILLRWLVPIGYTIVPCTASTLSLNMQSLRGLAPLALAKPAIGPGLLWSRLDANEMYALLPKTDKNDFGRIFETLRDRKLLDDVIQIPKRRRADRRERSRKGLLEARADVRCRQSFLHLPDAFVGECGWRCLWLIRILGPGLLSLLEEIYSRTGFRSDITRSVAMQKFNIAAKDNVAAWQWVDLSGGLISQLPFELKLRSQNGKCRGVPGRPLVWPPQTLPDLWQIAAVLQASHAFVVGLSGGPRVGEILSQSRDALVEDQHGCRIRGRTYKLVFREQGEERDWPAPVAAVEAVAQQVRLAELAQHVSRVYGYPNDGTQLWIQLPVQDHECVGKRLNSLEYGFKKLVSALDIQHLLPGESSRERNLHPHRLRKTTGRIVGLSLTNSIQVLMDLFGHENPEMTLGYLLCNKDIAMEAQAVAKAQTIMFAVDAIVNIDGAAGEAATRIRGEIDAFAKLRGLTKLDAKNINELAQDLTEDGAYWELVRPGVLCTKLPGQIGACNSRQGAPDSSHCRSGCEHRYEMTAQMVNVDRTVERIISHLELAISQDEPMAVEQWRMRPTAPRCPVGRAG